MTHEINLIALSMVPAVLWLAAHVVVHYWPRLRRRRKQWHAADYLIAGVFLHFALTAIGNTAFWGLHFIAEAFDHDGLRQATYRVGQLANIFTRLLPYIGASLLHLAAASIQGVPGVHSTRWYLLRTVVLTGASYLLLRIVT